MSRNWLLVHKGVNGSPVFCDARDYRNYRQQMRRVLALDESTKVRAVLAWALLPSAALMVLNLHGAGDDDLSVLSRLMTRLATRHTCRKFGLDELPQSLWSPSVLAARVHHDRIWEACRYVEISGVRTCLVSNAAGWPWSSVHDRRQHGVRRRLEGAPEIPRSWESYLVEGTGRLSQRVLSSGVTAGRVTYTRAS